MTDIFFCKACAQIVPNEFSAFTKICMSYYGSDRKFNPYIKLNYPLSDAVKISWGKVRALERAGFVVTTEVKIEGGQLIMIKPLGFNQAADHELANEGQPVFCLDKQHSNVVI